MYKLYATTDMVKIPNIQLNQRKINLKVKTAVLDYNLQKYSYELYT